MMHSQRMFPYLIGAAGLSAVLIAFGAPLATVLPFAIFLACPLMMFLMMRGMAGTKGREDHTGHGCEHDSTRTADSPTAQGSDRSRLSATAEPRLLSTTRVEQDN